MKKTILALLTCVLGLSCQSFADSTTPRLGLTKPTTTTADVWGAKLNNNFNLIDAGAVLMGSPNTFTASNTFTTGGFDYVYVATNAYSGSDKLAVNGNAKYFGPTGGVISMCDQYGINCTNMSLDTSNPYKGINIPTISADWLNISDRIDFLTATSSHTYLLVDENSFRAYNTDGVLNYQVNLGSPGYPFGYLYLGGATPQTEPFLGVGGAYQEVQFNGSGIFSGDSSFIWDSVNHRLGLGVASPNYRLDVSGDSNFTGFINQTIGGFGHAALGNSALISQRLTGYNGRPNVGVGPNAVGSFVDGGNGGSAGGNTGVGNSAISSSTGTANTALGDFAGAYLTGGNNNIFIGAGSGSGAGGGNEVYFGNGLILIGQYTGPSLATTILKNSVAIGDYTQVNSSYSFVIGPSETSGFTPYYVGIGTDTPKQRLHVSGNARIDNGFLQLTSKTSAEIKALTPSTVGQYYYCSNCTAVTTCVSTGTAVGAFSLITARTSACQ